jgi:hypothetical protein
VSPRGQTPRVSESTIDRIMRYNALGLRLYEYACEMLESALVAHGVDAKALALFKARNAGGRARQLTVRLLGLGNRRAWSTPPQSGMRQRRRSWAPDGRRLRAAGRY